jgi:hypothetical protein
MTDPRILRWAEAYEAMAREAKYRPAAPSDGMGGVYLSVEQASDPERLRRESLEYAVQFLAEEDTDSFWVGCSDFRTNKAFMWTIEAARQLASGMSGNATAVKLLEMAACEVRNVQRVSDQRQP